MAIGVRDSAPADARSIDELELALREGEQRFWALVNGTRDGVFMVDLDGHFIFVNDFIAESSGYPKEAFVGRHYLELIRPEDRERVRQAFDRTLAGETVAPYELAYRTAKGELMWVEVNSARVAVDGRTTGALAISRNIQARKAMEDELKESEEKYRTLIETLPHAVGIVQDGKAVFMNEAAKALAGADPADGAISIESFAAALERARVSALHRRRVEGDPGAPQHYRTLAPGPNGEIPLEIFIRPITYRGRPAFQCVAIDLSEQEALEAQVRQSQKMEALGTLAGGIAHDFNNVLTGIMAAAQLLQTRGGDPDQARESADLIERAARRAAALTRQLLGFSRKQEVVRTRVDLRRTVGEVAEILEQTLDKSIRLRQRSEPASAAALGDPTQLEQVLMNLAVNAADAMPDGGELSFEIDQVELDDAALRESFGIESGPYFCLAVHDTGVGIPPAKLPHIFEPFFTTKPVGKGSGMGLAVVYGIVRSHHGAIRVESTPNQGTRFSVYLPLASASAATQPDSVRTAPALGGGGVLVVDDEELLRKMASRLLDSLGYRAFACGSADQAIEVYSAHREEIDVAFVDVSMPITSGWACMDALRRLEPRLPVVMTSGRLPDPERVERLDQLARFLPKPYGLHELGDALATVLGRRGRLEPG